MASTHTGNEAILLGAVLLFSGVSGYRVYRLTQSHKIILAAGSVVGVIWWLTLTSIGYVQSVERAPAFFIVGLLCIPLCVGAAAAFATPRGRIIGASITGLLVFFAVVGIGIASLSPGDRATFVPMNEVSAGVRDGTIRKITISEDKLTFERSDGKRYLSRKEPGLTVMESLNYYGVTSEQFDRVNIVVTDPPAWKAFDGGVASLSSAERETYVTMNEVSAGVRDGTIRKIIISEDVLTFEKSDGKRYLSRKEPGLTVMENLNYYGVTSEQFDRVNVIVNDPPAWKGVLTILAIIISLGFACSACLFRTPFKTD
jgi:hypothetical protein